MMHPYKKPFSSVEEYKSCAFPGFMRQVPKARPHFPANVDLPVSKTTVPDHGITLVIWPVMSFCIKSYLKFYGFTSFRATFTQDGT